MKNKAVKRSNNAGFTLVEIMITIVIIGMLFTILVPTFKKAQFATQKTTFYNDIKTFRGALVNYNLATGEYPINQGPGIVPTGFESYINVATFTDTTPIGGNWDFEGPPNNNDYAGIGVARHTITMEELEEIDNVIDDGNTGTGSLQFKFISGPRVYWIVEEF